ncbi:hypothetical protein BURPS1655_D1177 [Burkholderia pseudomallei 1655]|nr:hypothetical protein BURPS1655_D1177 [Burkholderia pseudomallei 1655]
MRIGASRHAKRNSPTASRQEDAAPLGVFRGFFRERIGSMICAGDPY